jgi:hypothetical protein
MFAKIFLQGGGNFGTKLEEIAKGRGQVSGIRGQVSGIRYQAAGVGLRSQENRRRKL